MASEGRHSRHSVSYLPLLPSPGLDTISDYHGPAAEDVPRRRRRGPRDSHESAVGRLEQLADEGWSDTVQRDRRLRDRRERADASVRSTGLGRLPRASRCSMRCLFIALTSRSSFKASPILEAWGRA